MSLFSSAIGLASPISSTKIKATIIAIIIGGVLASGLGLYFYVNGLKKEIAELQGKVSSLTTDNGILTSNNSVLKSNLNAAFRVNATNDETIKSLVKEREDSYHAIETLAKKDVASAKKIKDLKDVIDKLKGDPTKDGPVAPILKDTIIEIQKMEQI